jgi:signal transduction histidine kinase
MEYAEPQVPDRRSGRECLDAVQIVTENPVVSGLLASVSGLLAVINESRQVLAVNEEFLAAAGLDSVADMIGLRPGEVLSCVYASIGPDGCGTGQACLGCGAAIAMAIGVATHRVVERSCILTSERDGRTREHTFCVRAQPIRISGATYLLLFMQDVSQERRLAALERVFFHDVNNTIQAAMGTVDRLELKGGAITPEAIDPLRRQIQRLADEVAAQRLLIGDMSDVVRVRGRETSVAEILSRLDESCRQHPAARGKRLVIQMADGGPSLTTDPALVGRVLMNMVVNGLEASTDGELVSVGWSRDPAGDLRFVVHNSAVLDPVTASRLFQRGYSTKDGTGRGLGCYAMKLFGEEMLGGTVEFTSTAERGTEFALTLPT